MSEREQTQYDKLIGEVDGDYYFLDYIFKDDLHGKPFNGATGTVLRPISKQEWEERSEPDNLREEYRDSWMATVERGETDLGLDEYLEYHDLSEPYYDDSGYKFWEQLRELGLSEEDYPVIECVGGGRCFDKNMKFDKVYAPDLIEKINEVEGERKS